MEDSTKGHRLHFYWINYKGLELLYSSLVQWIYLSNRILDQYWNSLFEDHLCIIPTFSKLQFICLDPHAFLSYPLPYWSSSKHIPSNLLLRQCGSQFNKPTFQWIYLKWPEICIFRQIKLNQKLQCMTNSHPFTIHPAFWLCAQSGEGLVWKCICLLEFNTLYHGYTFVWYNTQQNVFQQNRQISICFVLYYLLMITLLSQGHSLTSMRASAVTRTKESKANKNHHKQN